MGKIKNAAIAVVLLAASLTVNAQNNSKIVFGKGMKVTAADTSMSMKFQFRMQHLFDSQFTPGTPNSFKSNYLVRRARLKFGGHVYSDKLKYKVELGISNRDISVNKEDGQGRDASRIILDAVLKYQFAKHWQVWVGQTKLPGNRERVISSANLQFVNRSNVNSKFNIDRDMGLQLHGKYTLGEAFVIKPKFAWTMGEGRDITEGNHGGYNYTGRLEFLPFGEFEGKKDDYIASDLRRQSKPKLVLAGTVNYNNDAVRQQGQLGSFIAMLDTAGNVVTDSKGKKVYANNDLTAICIDAMFKYNGISFMGEFAQTSGRRQLDDISKNYNTGMGINTQLGYLFKSNFELAGRYTMITPDDEDYSGISEVTEYTMAASKYFVGHNLKVQSDVSYIDALGKDGAVRFRFQVEMQF